MEPQLERQQRTADTPINPAAGGTKRPRRPPPSASSSLPSSSSSSSARLRRRRQRIRDLERDAARRALNGDGACFGGLPPLPTASCDGDDDDDDGDDDDSGEGGGGGGGDLGTLFGHPYGALPHGNIHLATAPPPTEDGHGDSSSSWHPDVVRHRGLGPLLRALNDEQVLSILSYVDGPTLGGGVVSSSRFLYVAGHHEELWRDLVLRRWGEGGFRVPSPPSTGADEDDDGDSASKKEEKEKHGNAAAGCWKDVYAHNHRGFEATTTTTTTTTTTPTSRHEPIQMRGIYSDAFFRSFLCRSFALHPSWLSTHTVPSLPHTEVTTERFLREHEEKNLPLLVKGASSGWPALARDGERRWTSDYLLRATEGRTFRATSGAAPLPAEFALGDYLNYCASSSVEESPLYLFDRTFADKCPRLLEDFDPAMRDSCPWWNGSDDDNDGTREDDAGAAKAYHDLFGLLGDGRRPDHQWLIIGPKRSGSCFHIDPNCTHAWNAPIVGRKRWIFYPPGVTPPGVFPSPSGDDVCMPISIGEWFLTYWDQHVERRADPDPSRRPMECTACPGDMLFVPHGWWHMVLNIGDDDDDDEDSNGDRGVSVALTRNYVSASNLSDVLRFLDTRVSQISGCRDREEAVRPGDLGLEFRRALLLKAADEEMEDGDGGESGGGGGEEKKCDEGRNDGRGGGKGKWADLLAKAEKSAAAGWGCAAWVDLQPPCDSNTPMGACDDAHAREAKRRTTSGSSVLARAKQPPCATTDVDLNAGGSVGGADSSQSGGFTFSFL